MFFMSIQGRGGSGGKSSMVAFISRKCVCLEGEFIRFDFLESTHTPALIPAKNVGTRRGLIREIWTLCQYEQFTKDHILQLINISFEIAGKRP